MAQLAFRLGKNLLIQVGVLSTILALFILFFLIPQHTKTRRLARQVESLYVDNQRTQSLVLSSGHSGEKLQNIQKLLGRYRSMIPPRTQLPEVLDKIASRAEADGLEVLSLKPLRDIPYLADDLGLLKGQKLQVVKVVIGLEAKGHFFEIAHYLVHLENGPFKMIVEGVRFENTSPVKERTLKEPELTVTIDIGILMKFPSEEAVV